MAIPISTTGSLTPAFASARLVGLAVKLAIWVYPQRAITNRTEPTFERLRYNLGGDRPSQTARLAMSSTWLHRFELAF
jgi:hypothetical protein